MKEEFDLKHYYRGLDGLRTLAILSVILYHLMPEVCKGGFLGVPLFFSISGFLITAPLVKEKQTEGRINFKEFYLKRGKRIYPSLITVIIIVGCVAIFKEKDSNYLLEAASALFGVNNLWQMTNQVSYFDQFKDVNLLKHLWSLSVELQFYLILPIIIQKIVTKKEPVRYLREFFVITSLVSWLVLMIVYLLKGNVIAYYLFSGRFLSFGMGSLVSLYYHQLEKKISLNHSLLALLLVLISLFTISDYKSMTYIVGMMGFSALASLLIWGVASQEKMDKLFSNKIFDFIGTRSYDIYLWYYPVIVLYQKYTKWDGSYFLIHLIIQLLILGVLSEFTYNLSRYLVGKRDRKSMIQVLISFEMVCLVSVMIVSGFVISNQMKPVVTKSPQVTVTTKSTTESTTSESATKVVVPEEPKKRTIREVKHLLFLGDSVMLGAESSIYEVFEGKQITFNAVVGKQPYEILTDLSAVDLTGIDTVVIGLGNNGLIRRDEFDQVLKQLSDKNIVFITTTVEMSWQVPSNNLLKEYVKNNKNILLCDWNTYVEQHPENQFFVADGIHLTVEGQTAYSQEIKDCLAN
ncbi:MAG: acyltransferase family protein [Vagococcus sp.]